MVRFLADFPKSMLISMCSFPLYEAWNFGEFGFAIPSCININRGR